jgi:hypothetical protein
MEGSQFMGQIIKTKHHGEVEFEKTWRDSDLGHIGKLTAGGYSHFSGAAIKSLEELVGVLSIIGTKAEVAEAEEWWNNRGKDDETPARRIILEPDGSYLWEDGEPITSAAEIMSALPQGPQSEAVLAWFYGTQVEARKHADVIAEQHKAKADELKQEASDDQEKKRGPGRPKGSKNKKK